MFWLKGCRRCGGDVYRGDDNHGTYLACIQCGHDLTGEEIRQLLGLARPSPSGGPRKVAKPLAAASSGRLVRQQAALQAVA